MDVAVVYDGPIRSGGVGSESVDGFKVLGCSSCGLVFLDPVPEGLNSFYETHESRSRFDYDFDPASIHAKYDHEQNARIARIGVDNLRAKVVADLGSSAGVFLDAVSGVAARTIAVEPGEIYRDYLKRKGHAWYSYPQDAIAAGEQADVVVSFDVIEHVVDPREFVRHAFMLLKPGGRFVLSMPNLHDLILDANHAAFEPFFFQIAHLNYFGAEVIGALFEGSGFERVEVGFLHKYGIDNLVRWSKYGTPGGVTELDGVFDGHFDTLYRAEIERLGKASHLFITAEKP